MSEILAAWPQAAAQELALLRALDRTMIDALEEAEDLGLFESSDPTNYEVPSVAEHPQNAYRSGFYPITRVLADLWHRIAAHDFDRARTFAHAWLNSSFLLVRRLALFAFEHIAFRPEEAAEAVQSLDEETFWISGARVEIMRLLVARWSQFSSIHRLAIEARIRQGVPRNIYRADAFENEDEWNSIRDAYRRFNRIEQTGGALTGEGRALLASISARHPTWQPSPGDRDDFDYWFESHAGPHGQPELLASIADEQLVREAMQLQHERRFDQGDVGESFAQLIPSEPYAA